MNIVNNADFNNKTLHLMDNLEDFEMKIMRDLLSNEKAVIPTMSSTYGLEVKASCSGIPKQLLFTL